MDVRNRRRGSGVLKTSIDLFNGGLGAIASYNISGGLCTDANLGEFGGTVATTGIMTLGIIGAYKARSFISNINRKIRRNHARTKCLREMAEDGEFLKEHNLERKKLGRVKSGLKYLLTVPLGGALGYIPGTAGIIPLCIYFGEYYSRGERAGLDSGAYTGAAIGAYAFAEMTSKKQWRRMVVSSFALAGVTASHFINEEVLDLSLFNSESDLWTGLAVNAGSAIVGGLIGNTVYQKIKGIVTRQKLNTK